MNDSVSFIRLARITLCFVYIVIIAGAVVRATGSGMGCPDWPRCFGQWIPPTDVKELPADYKTRYGGKQGQADTFNVVKTWTEYLNRWAGVVLGLLMAAQIAASYKTRRTHPLLFRFAIAGLLLTGMEGVLGAIVVFTHLKTGVITLHMFLSLVILATQATLLYKCTNRNLIASVNPLLKPMLIAGMGLVTLQILLGTQVRERVDQLLPNFDAGTRWDILNNLGIRFTVHGLFAWTLSAFYLALLIFILRDRTFFSSVKKLTGMLVCVLILEMSAGIILKQFALPVWVQPIHLLLATLLFGLQWAFVLRSAEMNIRRQ
ncbi:MAG: heme A synthase [Bacteroidia bacterium]